MILKREEAEALKKLLTCPKCGSRKVEIFSVGGKYFKRCLDCRHCEELEGVEWD